jgi:serine protease AprX
MANPSKIHPRLADRLKLQTLAPAAQPVALPIIVKYRAGIVAPAAAAEGVLSTGYTYRIIPASAHTATPGAIDRLSERNDVEMIWYDEKVHTLLDRSVPLISAPLVWQKGFTGKGIKVGIVDTGIDPTHPDFAGRVIALVNFVDDRTVNDENGHGTHVAGIVGGSGAASNGKYKGVAPECVFYSAKVLDYRGYGSFSSVMAGIEWAVQQGVQVINLSLGADGSCDGTDAMSETCDAAVNRGVVVCVAAGNAGPGERTVGSPGCAKLVITVGATDKSDQIAYFSSRGPTGDGRIKPDVCFPGVDIISCRAANTSEGQPVGDKYTTLSGTSMATPHATGACAVLLQSKPGLSPHQVKDLVMSSARNLGLDPNTQGSGRGDVYAAYQRTLRSITNVTFSPTEVTSGDLLNVSITVKNEGTAAIPTQGPDPGFVYEEGDSFISRGFADVKGAFRVAVDFDGRTGVDHPYRWGLGAPLAPGETRTITGAIRLKKTSLRNYWAGLVEEQTAWFQDREKVTLITVTPGFKITDVKFSPTTVAPGQLLSVSITVKNEGGETLQTQGPDPGFQYEEGDTFVNRGFASSEGNFRVGVEFDNRTGIDHPYRWGLGAPLPPGETRVINGAIRLKSPQSQNYWVGLVQEFVAWFQDRKGAQLITVPSVTPGPKIVSATIAPTALTAGQYLVVTVVVRNDGNTALPTQGPDPGFLYIEGDTFITRGFPDATGNFRIGVDFDGRAGIDHPYRWGLGSPLAPGETRTITGLIQLRTPQARNYWVGLVQEHLAWMQDRTGTTLVTVKPGITITDVTLAPTTLSAGQLLNVGITIRNDGDVSLPTQGPDPGFVYEEGETFESRGFGAVGGNFRVGIDFANRTGVDHPYRWGLGSPLAPGETRTINGAIRLKNPQSQKYWAGLVQEYVAWLQDRQGEQNVTVQ